MSWVGLCVCTRDNIIGHGYMFVNKKLNNHEYSDFPKQLIVFRLPKTEVIFRGKTRHLANRNCYMVYLIPTIRYKCDEIIYIFFPS